MLYGLNFIYSSSWSYPHICKGVLWGKLPLNKTFDLPHKGVQKLPLLYQLLLHLHL